MAWPRYLHPFTPMEIASQVTQCFPALGSTAEITSPWQTDFQQFFSVCWPEPEFSLMLNINIGALLLFSPSIDKVSTGRRERYSLLRFCCDNVKQKPCLVLSRGPSLSYRKHNCTLLKYHPGATEPYVDVLFTAPVIESFGFPAVLTAVWKTRDYTVFLLCCWSQMSLVPHFSICHIRMNIQQEELLYIFHSSC